MKASREFLIDLLLHGSKDTPLIVKPYPQAQENHHGQNSLFVQYGSNETPYGVWTTFGDLAIALIEAERRNPRLPGTTP